MGKTTVLNIASVNWYKDDKRFYITEPIVEGEPKKRNILSNDIWVVLGKLYNHEKFNTYIWWFDTEEEALQWKEEYQRLNPNGILEKPTKLLR